MSFFRHGMPDGPGFPKVPVTPSIESFLSHSVGAAPLVAALCRDLGIPQLIDQEATWDKDRSILSPGERIMALIINLLCKERRPLYKVHDAFEKLDTGNCQSGRCVTEDPKEGPSSRDRGRTAVSGKCKIPPKWEMKNPPSPRRRRDDTRGSPGRKNPNSEIDAQKNK